MEFTGEVTDVSRDWETNRMKITFSVNEPEAVNEVHNLKDTKLSIKAVKFRNKRSRDANALLWACLKEIADVLRTDKWNVYLQMLKRYGKFTYIVVKENAVEAMKAQWRECEVVGDIMVNGSKAVQLLCYFGSSHYDSKEFSILLDGVVSEMKELGLQPPISEEMERALEQWERQHEKRTTEQ